MKFTNSIRTSMCITVLTLLLTISSFAQAPEKMSYQAVIRDAENALVTSQQVGMQISILQGDVAVYEETQTPTSNTNGLVSLEIGEGTVISGSFTAIDWSVDTSFIKIETDPTGGTNYTITGTSQLLSVPYALYAKTSSDASAVAVNSDKVGYTEVLVSANTDVAANTAKTGITSEQTSAITANTDKAGYSDAAAAAVALNTAKTVITSDQSDAITANTDKVSYSDAAAAAVALNTAKTVITSDQSDAITANTDKVGSTGLSGLSDALVETNSLYIGNDPSAVTDDAQKNVAIGTTALSSNTTGDENTAIGYDALASNTTGDFNTASGSSALHSNTTGSYNIATGYAALEKNTTGANNIAIGRKALSSNTAGSSNIASGYEALKSNTTGNSNTATGREALTSNTTGDNNTAIGYQADVVANNLTNATAIGNGALVASSNTMQLGNRSITDVLTSGKITASGFINSSIYLVNTYYEELGGYVIQVSPNGKHGIVVAMQDQGPSDWYSANDLLSDPTKHDPAGAEFLDWRLPAKRELDLMHEQRVAVGNFTTNYYWSSTESGYNYAWGQYFDGGGQSLDDSKHVTSNVRAVRAF